jgi:hypothetical protein
MCQFNAHQMWQLVHGLNQVAFTWCANLFYARLWVFLNAVLHILVHAFVWC